MKWKSNGSAADNAKEHMPELALEYFDAGRDAVKRKRSARDLHRFRIRTKRFRYALEIFMPAYGPALEQQLESLQQVQKLLGKISDIHTIRGLLKKDRSFKKGLDREGDKQIEAFREYWKSTFDAPDQLRAWTTALGHPGSPPGRSKAAKKQTRKKTK